LLQADGTTHSLTVQVPGSPCNGKNQLKPKGSRELLRIRKKPEGENVSLLSGIQGQSETGTVVLTSLVLPERAPEPTPGSGNSCTGCIRACCTNVISPDRMRFARGTFTQGACLMLSNPMGSSFCIDCMKDAFHKYGTPHMFISNAASLKSTQSKGDAQQHGCAVSITV